MYTLTKYTSPNTLQLAFNGKQTEVRCYKQKPIFFVYYTGDEKPNLDKMSSVYKDFIN